MTNFVNYTKSFARRDLTFPTLEARENNNNDINCTPPPHTHAHTDKTGETSYHSDRLSVGV